MTQVTVFSTKGKRKSVVVTEANTWGELKKDLLKEGIETTGFKAIVGENQVTLESSAASLPKGLTPAGEVTKDFTLFLNPIKVKSGMGGVIDPETMSYLECRSFIKEVYNSSEESKKHFGNYTNLSTDKMRILIKSWVTSNLEEVSASPVEIIDNVIVNLQVLRGKILSGEVKKEEVVDEIAVLSAWYEEIEANM